jgi:hypothetical protein
MSLVTQFKEHKMTWFSHKRMIRRRSQEQRLGKFTTQLLVESLEDRCVPTVNYYGGALLTNVEAQAVYYGNAWDSGTYASQKTTLDSFLSYIVNSPYTQALTNAGYGVDSGTASAGVVDPANLAAGTTLQDSQIQGELQSLISNGTVAAPDANRLYVIYVEPNVIVSLQGATSQRNFLGYHSAFGGHTAGGQAIDIHYAVIAYPGGAVGNASNVANPVDDMTSVTSHELAEAMTDPNVGYKTLGWYDKQLNEEIGDITEKYLVRLNGYLVQEVAGKNDQPLTLSTGTGGTGQTGQTATQTTLSISASQVHVGQTVTLTLTVAPTSESSTPCGTVTLMDGNHVLGKVKLGTNGHVSVTLYANWGSVGTHTITAVYQGNSSFMGSTSNAVTLTVLAPVFQPFSFWVYYDFRHTH